MGLMLISGSVASAAEEKPVRSISVTGTAGVKTAPDLIVWSIGLRENDKDLLAAKKRSDEKVKAVLALRQKLGVKEGDVETGPIYVRREYERDQHGNQGNFKYFVVNRSVTIRQTDLKRFDEFLDSLVSSAEMEVSFHFESSRIHEVRAKTRLEALKIAKDKAEKMAAVVGAKLGPVITINEHSPQSGGWRDYASQNAGFTESRPSVDLATGTFVPGAITEQVTVYITFALE
jgi:hypothetical protein